MNNNVKVETNLRIVSIFSSIILLTVISIKVIFHSHELVNIYGFLLDVILNISTSFSVSYIFFMVAYLPEKRRKESILKFSERNISRIIQEIIELETLVSEMVAVDNISLDASPRKKTKVNKITNERTYYTYRDHFTYFFNTVNRQYSELSVYTHYLDDQLRDRLHKVIDSSIMQRINSLLMLDQSYAKDRMFIDSLAAIEVENMLNMLREDN